MGTQFHFPDTPSVSSVSAPAPPSGVGWGIRRKWSEGRQEALPFTEVFGAEAKGHDALVLQLGPFPGSRLPNSVFSVFSSSFYVDLQTAFPSVFQGSRRTQARACPPFTGPCSALSHWPGF